MSSKPIKPQKQTVDKSQEKVLKTVAKGAGIIFIGMILGYFLGYLTRLIIARYLGAESYGLISLGLAILGFFSTFALLGFLDGIPRFVSYYKNVERKRSIIIVALKISLPLSILFSLILFFFSPQISLFFNKP
ncbi:MAG: oligosaccharide flippase family protein, partial [Candidatus Aenigmarchaeota archaeon]|nr:oligosaccharide flippase family protein [Candidatus Aenigmarchaeota archaeon]